MKNKNILVTGGAGNIGGSLSRYLVSKGYNVTIFDNLITGDKKKLPSKNLRNWNFIKGDTNKLKDFKKIKKYKFDYIFHYAAFVGVKRTLSYPQLVLNDIKGFENILNFAVSKKVKRIFFSSSSEIYGEPVSIPQYEDITPLNSKLPYAIVKNVGEAYFKTYNKLYNLDYTIFRFFNTYGPLQSDDFVITNFIKNCLKNKNLIINGDGRQTRTFIYIKDNIEITHLILKKEYFKNQIVNLGSDREISIINLAKKIIKVLNSKSKIKFKAALKEGDMSRRKPGIKKIKKIYKKKLISLDEGIAITANFLKNGINKC
jgi:UDP-glucuronate decarboxylase